ncbi:hypothetical protein MVES1_003580 [Malassezia vespertilionis]|uniref:uncharacterized protein n=1 Tax=Malassezia vespertilionis TaxID=2020962 RepID=UPI0024B0775A|nr:uncharacterized protein MVES1_003580 [Malassezia vespertilionis]WFD08208.1 hypothetical protein MVES1_003580 [Malassezia vespertilionis]
MSNKANVMSNREYDAFLKEQKAGAFKLCDPVVREFVECSKGRAQNKKMYDCLQYHDETLKEAEKAYLARTRVDGKRIM